jgi:hypothetical protein
MKYNSLLSLCLLVLFSFVLITCEKNDEVKGTCVDGIQNEGETGVDCGGPCAACNSESVTTPTVVTIAPTNITATKAESGGVVTSDGNAAVTSAGVCWSTSPDPSIADSHTNDYPFPDSYTSSMERLNVNTTYYLKAFAINSAGIAYGNEISFTTDSILQIGDLYGGGIVFYIDSTQAHGYICAENNQGTASQWGCVSTSVPGATGTAVGTGEANTSAIVAANCGAGYAAVVCYNLVQNGYSDWFLPSREELRLMAVNLANFGIGNFISTSYWSSTQSSTSGAYTVTFPSGSTSNSSKDNSWRVRAVRKF